MSTQGGSVRTGPLFPAEGLLKLICALVALRDSVARCFLPLLPPAPPPALLRRGWLIIAHPQGGTMASGGSGGGAGSDAGSNGAPAGSAFKLVARRRTMSVAQDAGAVSGGRAQQYPPFSELMPAPHLTSSLFDFECPQFQAAPPPPRAPLALPWVPRMSFPPPSISLPCNFRGVACAQTGLTSWAASGPGPRPSVNWQAQLQPAPAPAPHVQAPPPPPHMNCQAQPAPAPHFQVPPPPPHMNWQAQAALLQPAPAPHVQAPPPPPPIRWQAQLQPAPAPAPHVQAPPPSSPMNWQAQAAQLQPAPAPHVQAPPPSPPMNWQAQAAQLQPAPAPHVQPPPPSPPMNWQAQAAQLQPAPVQAPPSPPSPRQLRPWNPLELQPAPVQASPPPPSPRQLMPWNPLELQPAPVQAPPPPPSPRQLMPWNPLDMDMPAHDPVQPHGVPQNFTPQWPELPVPEYGGGQSGGVLKDTTTLSTMDLRPESPICINLWPQRAPIPRSAYYPALSPRTVLMPPPPDRPRRATLIPTESPAYETYEPHNSNNISLPYGQPSSHPWPGGPLQQRSPSYDHNAPGEASLDEPTPLHRRRAQHRPRPPRRIVPRPPAPGSVGATGPGYQGLGSAKQQRRRRNNSEQSVALTEYPDIEELPPGSRRSRREMPPQEIYTATVTPLPERSWVHVPTGSGAGSNFVVFNQFTLHNLYNPGMLRPTIPGGPPEDAKDPNIWVAPASWVYPGLDYCTMWELRLCHDTRAREVIKIMEPDPVTRVDLWGGPDEPNMELEKTEMLNCLTQVSKKGCAENFGIVWARKMLKSGRFETEVLLRHVLPYGKDLLQLWRRYGGCSPTELCHVHAYLQHVDFVIQLIIPQIHMDTPDGCASIYVQSLLKPEEEKSEEAVGDGEEEDDTPVLDVSSYLDE